MTKKHSIEELAKQKKSAIPWYERLASIDLADAVIISHKHKGYYVW